MIATSVVLLLLTASLVEPSCLFCASSVFTMYPHKFKDITRDRTVDSDAKCARNLTKVYNPAGCNGACLTVNVTLMGGTESYGVLRDCLDSHKKVKKWLEAKREADSLDSLAGVCYSENVYVRNAMHTATYCACVGRHCNSEGTPLAAVVKEEGEATARVLGRRGSRTRSRPNGVPAGVQSLSSLAFVALLTARRL